MLANIKTPNLDKILDFKESLIVLILISVLFIILSAKISLDELKLLELSSFIYFSFL